MSYPRYPRTYFDVVDGATPINSELFGKFTDAIINIQDQLGDNPSGVFSNIRQRLDSLEVGNNDSLYHNTLLGLQGGTVDGYYHLTDNEHTWLTDGYSDGYWKINKGGTGIISYNIGDILYANSANTLAKQNIGPDGYILTVSGNTPVWSAPNWNYIHQLVAGLQYADGGAGLYKIVGSTETFDPNNLGFGTKTHFLKTVGNVPLNSDGYIQLYDVTNHASLYESTLLTYGTFEISVPIILASGLQRIEFWIMTNTDSGGNLSCLQAALITTFI